MKKLLGLSLAIVVGFILGALSLALCLTARAGTEPTNTTTLNGDGNGDGSVDVSDAVYLLNWLFAGGPDMASIDCPDPQPYSALPATGQTQCFGTANVIDCALDRARGQDAFHQVGCPLEGRLVDNGDGTVSDNCTGLMWTKNNVDVDNDGEIIMGGFGFPAADQLPWLEACQFADDMTFAGQDDWRVPNAQELLSIMNLPQAEGWNRGNPTPFFLYPPFNVFRSWSSTYLNESARALGFNLLTGSNKCDCCFLKFAEHGEPQLFMAVRGPQ
jgi:hypothetical protein